MTTDEEETCLGLMQMSSGKDNEVSEDNNECVHEGSDNESEDEETESLINDEPELTIIDNCGSCILAQVDDSYKQHYFDDLYGSIHCTTKGCENKRFNVEQLIKKHGQVHICEKFNIRDMIHGCQQMLCHDCWTDKTESEGRPRRSMRRATMV